MPKLTARGVDALSKPGRHSDGDGLYLNIRKGGSKAWELRYKRHGKPHYMGLGSAKLLTLAEARQKARDARRLLHLEGADPITARREQLAEAQVAGAGLTFAEAAERYIATHEASWKNAKHREQWRHTIATYAEPLIGHHQVSAVTTEGVLAVLEPIWATKTETASRLRGRLEAILDWSRSHGLREGENPARWRGHLKNLLPAPSTIQKVQHQPALAIDAVPDWWRDLTGRIGVAACALQFLTLTAARSGEVLGMVWAEVDLPKAIWTVPGARMKMARDHRVPLSRAAVGLLGRVPRLHGTDLVFPADRGGRLSDMALADLMRRMHRSALGRGSLGYCDPASARPAVPHGLRSTFRDWAAECTDYPREMAEIALAHAVGDATERAYRRGDMLERRRRMMEDWAGVLHGDRAASSPVLRVV
ncbi:MAG: integrase arm-type DNA-binding domain-containing protein [Pseudomonadota bacterium]